MQKIASTLERIKQAALEALVARYEQEMHEADLPPSLHMGINPPPETELDGISAWDGTGDRRTYPEFATRGDEGIRFHGS